MVPMIEDHPRRPVNDIEVHTAVQLMVPFGRGKKKLVVGEGISLPPDHCKEISKEQIPVDYYVVYLTWYVTEYEEYEMDYPTPHGVRFLGLAMGSEVLWNREDIELIPPTPMPTSQPSIAGSSPPDPDDGGGNDEGDGGDDKGKNSPRGTSPPPPPPKSPPPKPSNAAGCLEAAPGRRRRLQAN
jgi:hypothetical protein